MYEMFLAMSMGSTPTGQTIVPTPQIGQIVTGNGYGHCTSGTKFYILFGQDVNLTALTKLFSYDIINNTWEDLGNVPVGMGSNVYWSLVAIDQDTLFASCRLIKAKYKISTKTWTVLPAIPSGNANTNRFGIRSHLYNGKVYYVGRNSSNSTNGAMVYDPATDTVTALATTTFDAGNYGGSILYNGKIYVFPPSTTYSILIYDIASNSFTSRTNAPALGAWMGVHESGGIFYLFGGVTNTSPNQKQVLTYNPVTGIFGVAPNLSRVTQNAMTYMYDNQVVIWGGRSFDTTKPAYTDFLTYKLSNT